MRPHVPTRCEQKVQKYSLLDAKNSMFSSSEKFTKLHCVPQQEVMKKSLSKEDEVTAKQQSSGAIREMLKEWEKTVTSYIEKHHPNKAVVMHATNLFYDKAVSSFRQILKHQKKMSLAL
ncbi:hypothetical protein AVEN_69348-1 [Araneus ventricosus]|uniref:Uncharacterized protein n=1 Tax=Araneus ventricosus TaxID=182803 RepID=A0A4Y2JWP9_ARAVE|nr:hypothetical protein AVEN_69348-1 [Araneus ventricosus]